MKKLEDSRKTSSLPALNYDDGIEIKNLRRVSSVDNVSEFTAQDKKARKLQEVRQAMTMAERLEKTAPYNIFFNCLEELPETYEQPNAIHFHGKFMVLNFFWMFENNKRFARKFRSLNILLLYQMMVHLVFYENA